MWYLPSYETIREGKIEMPSIAEIIDIYPLDKLTSILSTDSWPLEQLVEAIAATKDPARLRLLLAALGRLLAKIELIKRRAEKRLQELVDSHGKSDGP